MKIADELIVENLAQIDFPNVNLECGVCGQVQTFKPVFIKGSLIGAEYIARLEQDHKVARQMALPLIYKCANCENPYYAFLIQIDKVNGCFIKFGQYPRRKVKIDKALEKALGEEKDNYRKGLECEGEGYWIGAYAYYRRIVEAIIGKLLVDLQKIIPEDRQSEYNEALNKIKKEVVASKKIEIVKELLPDSLRPGGHNPLGILYGALSGGIHEYDEDKCSELAPQIKKVLEYLIKVLHTHKTESREFKDSMGNLLGKASPGKSTQDKEQKT
jgi:hypothetical protein